jgi:hypothetical protein
MKYVAVKKVRTFVAVLVISVVIHVIFCVQVFMALPSEIGLDGGSLIFFPHYLLMQCFPMSFPLSDNSINYVALWGELLTAFPASIMYSLCFVRTSILLLRCLRR